MSKFVKALDTFVQNIKGELTNDRFVRLDGMGCRVVIVYYASGYISVDVRSDSAPCYFVEYDELTPVRTVADLSNMRISANEVGGVKAKLDKMAEVMREVDQVIAHVKDLDSYLDAKEEPTASLDKAELLSELNSTRLGKLANGDMSRLVDILSIFVMEEEVPSGLTMEELIALLDKVVQEVIMQDNPEYTVYDILHGLLGRVDPVHLRAMLKLPECSVFDGNSIFERVALAAAGMDRACYSRDDDGYDSEELELEQALDYIETDNVE